jgi:predicted PurR-regulated permease PerM
MKQHRHRNSFIVFWIMAALILVAATYIITPFIPALLWATVFAILTHPMYEKMVAKGYKPTVAAILVTLIPAFVLIIPLGVMGSVAGFQIVSYVQELLHNPNGSASVRQDVLVVIGAELDRALQPVLNQFGVTDLNMAEVLDRNKNQIADRIVEPLTNGAKAFITTIVTLVIAMLTMFFMVRDAHNMKDPALDLVPLPREDAEKILQQIAITVRSVFHAVVLVAGIQGFCALLLYLATGVPGAFVLALITTVLCMIPLLGGPVVYAPVGLSLLLQGKIWQGVIVLLVGFGIISQIDNILRPFFIGGQTNLHPIAIFFALLGGVLVLGPVGLMAGPIVLTLVLAIIDILRIRKAQEDLEEDSE